MINNFFENKIIRKNTNPHQEAQNKFCLKTFINKLPTLDEMFGHYPNTYKDDFCPLCKTIKETNTHIFTCPTRRKLTIAKLSSSIIKAITPFATTKEAIEFTKTHIRPSNLFTIDHARINLTEVTKNSNFSITDTFRFLIPKSLVSYIRKHLKKSSQTTKLIISKISQNLIIALKEI